MKMAKRVLAIVMCVALFASFSVMSMSASAEGAKESVDGVRYFAADMSRNNGYDDMWEVECGDNTYQRFNEADSNEEAAEAYLTTEFSADGALTITRTGADGNDNYWPRVRTLYLESSPAIDLTTANTLHYDFTATEGWMIDIVFSGMELKLGKAISEANGATGLANSDADGVAGTYKGTLNLTEVIAKIAGDSADPHSTEMTALKNMKKTFAPQVVLFVVGSKTASATFNSLYISTADDTTGEKCDLMDMGLVYGDEVYELGTEGGDDTAPADESDDTAATTKAAATTTTKANAAAASTDFPTWAIIAIIAGVVVVVVIVVVVVVVSKKKGGNDTTPPVQ